MVPNLMVGVGLVGEQQPFGKGIDDPRAAATTTKHVQLLLILLLCVPAQYIDC